MSRWTSPLLTLATDGPISRRGYGRDYAGLPAGVAYAIADPFGDQHAPDKPHVHCSAWAFEAIVMGHRMLERDTWPPPRASEWKLAFQWDGADPRGIALMAHQRGVAEKPVEGLPSVLEGQWYACQGHRKGGGGHTFLALAHAGGLVYLEANGKAAGGAVLGGLDGVGSRHAEPRNSRDWPKGNWPPILKPATVEEVRGTYATLWTARLA